MPAAGLRRVGQRPLRAAYLGAVPADARGNATAVMNTAIYVLTASLAGLLVAGQGGLLTTPSGQLVVLAVFACAWGGGCRDGSF